MNNQQKRRYEELKSQNKKLQKEIDIKNNILLQECLKALKSKAYVLSNDEEKVIYDKFVSVIPFAPWGVDWNQINVKSNINDVKQLIELCLNKDYYIIWGEGMPIIKSNINSIINSIDDVLAVDFDTWLLSVDYNEIIEFYHEGEVKIGQVK